MNPSGSGATPQNTWRKIQALANRLLDAADQGEPCALVTETAHRLVEAEVQLWLVGSPPDSPLGAPPCPRLDPDIGTALMRRALDARRTAADPPGNAPHALAVPLLSGQHVLGVLEASRPDGPPFTEGDISLLQAIADQAALGLRTAREVAAERRRSQQLSLVATVGAQVAALTDIEQLAQRVTEVILTTFSYYYVALFTLEPGQDVLRRRASAGPVDRGSAAGVPETIMPGQGLVGYAAATGTPLVANDVTLDGRYRHVDALPEARAEVALPLCVEGRVLGVLDVQSNKPNAFDDTDMVVLRALADAVAIALENARLYSDLSRRAEQLSAVSEVNRAVASILDQDTLFDKIVSLIHDQFGYPSVHLFTVDHHEGKVVYRAGSGRRSRALAERGVALDLNAPQGIIPWVARQGQTVLANDVAQDTRFLPSELPPAETRAVLAVPLRFGDRVLGVLDVQSDQAGAFTASDQFVFETLANGVATAIRNANLYRTERWRRQVADGLRELVGLLSADLDLERLLDALLTQLEHILTCQVAAVWLIHDGNLCLSAVHGAPADICTSRLSDSSAWLYAALGSDRPIVRTPQDAPEPTGLALGFEHDYSAIAAPLRIASRPPMGILTLTHPSARRYGDEASTILTAFANSAAVAIENTRLFRSTQEQAWVSTVMLEIAKSTQSLSDPQEVIETAVRLIPVLADVERCAVVLWDASTGAFLPATAQGLSPNEQATFEALRILPAAEPTFEHLLSAQTPLLLGNSATPVPSTSALAALGFSAPALLPLLAQGELVGTLLVEQRVRDSLDPLGQMGSTAQSNWLAVLQGIAYQMSAAIDNTLLRREQQEDAYVSAALLQVAQAIAAANDLDEMLGAVVRIAPALVGVDRCAIYLWEAEANVFEPRQAYGLSRETEPQFRARRFAPGEFPLLDRARQGAKPVTFVLRHSHPSDPSAQPQILPEAFQDIFWAQDASSARSLMAIPLLAQSSAIGVMLVEEIDSSRGSGDRRLEILTGIASQVAGAVQNSRLQLETARRLNLERELQLARDIQQSLMPRQLPQPPGWEIAAECLPAQQVGGDFFDVFELPEHHLGIVIADVADKGMPAALFMALTRSLIRTIATEGLSPAAVLARVNNLMLPDAQHGMFVTALYAVLALDSGALTYANAGHNPPLMWRRATQQVERLRKGEIALGVMADGHRQDHRTMVGPGDRLILYTDGVTEAFSAARDTFFGDRRLEELIEASQDEPAQRILERIVASVNEFAGLTPQADDLTSVVIRRIEDKASGAN